MMLVLLGLTSKEYGLRRMRLRVSQGSSQLFGTTNIQHHNYSAPQTFNTTTIQHLDEFNRVSALAPGDIGELPLNSQLVNARPLSEPVWLQFGMIKV
jgi:hypothetical protein